MVCGCVLHWGQIGEAWCVSSTLCRYDIRMGLLLVRSWAKVRRVSLGRESSSGDHPVDQFHRMDNLKNRLSCRKRDISVRYLLILCSSSGILPPEAFTFMSSA